MILFFNLNLTSPIDHFFAHPKTPFWVVYDHFLKKKMHFLKWPFFTTFCHFFLKCFVKNVSKFVFRLQNWQNLTDSHFLTPSPFFPGPYKTNWTNISGEKFSHQRTPVWFFDTSLPKSTIFLIFLHPRCQNLYFVCNIGYFFWNLTLWPLSPKHLFEFHSKHPVTSKVLSFFKNKHAFRKQIIKVQQCCWIFWHMGYCQTDMSKILCMFAWEKRNDWNIGPFSRHWILMICFFKVNFRLSQNDWNTKFCYNVLNIIIPHGVLFVQNENNNSEISCKFQLHRM